MKVDARQPVGSPTAMVKRRHTEGVPNLTYASEVTEMTVGRPFMRLKERSPFADLQESKTVGGASVRHIHIYIYIYIIYIYIYICIYIYTHIYLTNRLAASFRQL